MDNREFMQRTYSITVNLERSSMRMKAARSHEEAAWAEFMLEAEKLDNKAKLEEIRIRIEAHVSTMLDIIEEHCALRREAEKLAKIGSRK